jgi:integrase
MFSKNLDYGRVLDDFLHFKRECGYKYKTEEIILKAFYRYTQTHKESKLGFTMKFIEHWSRPKIKEGKKSVSNRISVLREFAIYLNRLGYKAYIPTQIKNARNKSFIPYIFSKEEIDTIFQEIDYYPDSSRNRYNSNEIYPVLFRVLYGCGLRISEALNLKIKDVDTVTGRVEIYIAKNDIQRVVMMSRSLREICHRYKTNYLSSKDENTTFFQHKDGSIRSINRVNRYFHTILYRAKIPYLGRGKGPYLHNLRHTFACHSFYQMHRDGLNMSVSLPILSNYMGHSTIHATERYLKLTQSLFGEIVSRVEDTSSGLYREVVFEKE